MIQIIMQIPLEQYGTKLCFQSRSPAQHKLEAIPNERRIVLNNCEEWEPTTFKLGATVSSKLKSNDHDFYFNSLGDAALLHSISPHLVMLKE